MSSDGPAHNRLQSVLSYGVALLLCLLIQFSVMKLRKADITIPYGDSGDGMFSMMLVKQAIDTGWYLHNDRVGAPFGQDMSDFPLAETWHFLALKSLALVFHNPILVFNLYFLLTFPLTTLTSLFVFRRFGFSFMPALAASLLYAFAPYHFFRGMGHYFLSCYYLIPLATMVILWVAEGRTLFLTAPADGGRLRWSVRNATTLAAAAICVATASAGVYYAFFTGFFLLVAGAVVSFRRQSRLPLYSAGVLIGIIGATLLVNISPTFVKALREGKNRETGQRSVLAAEIYGLRISQMVLPIPDHRYRRFRDFRTAYSNALPLVNENDLAALGLLTSAGFLLLCGRWLFLRPATDKPAILDMLSVLTVAGVLLGTMGGFGALFARFVSPKIQAYNRISIYLAFFAVFMVAVCMEWLLRRYSTSRVKSTVCLGILGVLLAVGLWDEIPPGFAVPPYSQLKDDHAKLSRFFTQVEGALDEGAMVYQLPHSPFPEFPPIEKMSDYSHFCCYIYSKHLRWSYGAAKGRAPAVWLDQAGSKPPEELVPWLAHAGFTGIYVDGFGYADGGKEICADLAKILGVAPVVSEDGRRSFFNLTDYVRRQIDREGREAWEANRQATLYRLCYCWKSDFDVYPSEAKPDWWRGCSGSGEFAIANTSTETRQVTIKLDWRLGMSGNTPLKVKSSLLPKRLTFSPDQQVVLENISVPPGRHRFLFSCGAPPVKIPSEPHPVAFQVGNLSVQEVH